MRTTPDLEKMIDGMAQVKAMRIKYRKGLLVAPWPEKRTLYVDHRWLNESLCTDDEVRQLLYSGLAIRSDWLFNVVSIIGDGGSSLLVVAFLWNMIIVPVLNYNFGTNFLIDHAPIMYGAIITAFYLLLRFSLQGTIERRASRFYKNVD